MDPTVEVPVATKINAARAAVTAHRNMRDKAEAALHSRDRALRDLATAGLSVPEIDRAIGGTLSRSSLRVILGRAE